MLSKIQNRKSRQTESCAENAFVTRKRLPVRRLQNDVKKMTTTQKEQVVENIYGTEVMASSGGYLAFLFTAPDQTSSGGSLRKPQT